MHQFSAFKTFRNIIHGISSSADGNMSFAWGQKAGVVKNRKRFLDTLGISIEDCAAMKVLHGTEIAVVDRAHRGRGMLADDAIESDGLITNIPGLYLFLLTADCLPILFYDPGKKVLALVHAGWKSTHGKIAAKTVRMLAAKYNCDPADIFVGIGPGIHKESYVFPSPSQILQSKTWEGKSIARQMPTGFNHKFLADWGNFIEKLPDNSFSLDIVGYNKQQLMESGISEKHIEISPIDTAQSPDFFSHHRAVKTAEKEGRFATVLGMKSI